jgi:hypothetical protein
LGFSSKGRRIETPSDSSGRRGLHDAGARAGDDHPSVAGQRGGDIARLAVERVVLQGARRPEHRDLRHPAERREEPERIAHLGKGRRRDLEVEPLGVVLAEQDRCAQQPHHQPTVGVHTRLVEHGVDLGAQRRGESLVCHRISSR